MKHVLDKEKTQQQVRPRRGRRSSRAPAGSRRWRSTGATRWTRRTTASTATRRKRDDVKGNYPNTVNPLLGGGDMAGYQAGSTFKIFTMLAALDDGHAADHVVLRPAAVRLEIHHRARPGRPAAIHWCPKNSSKSMTGRQTMWSGFGKSVNTYFVQLEQKVGAEKAVRMAERLGLTLAHRRRPDAGHAGARRRLGRLHPRASATPPRSRWPTSSPPSPPRATTASRCRSRRSSNPDGTQRRRTRARWSPRRAATRRSAPRSPGRPRTRPAA